MTVKISLSSKTDRYNCHAHREMCVIDTSKMKAGEAGIIMNYKDLDGRGGKRQEIIFNMINTAVKRGRKKGNGILSPIPVTYNTFPHAILLSRKSFPAEGYETVITVR